MIKISYSGYRFPPQIIQHAIWLYLRFTLSFRDVEDLLAKRGIMVSYETVRRWVNHFGPMSQRTCANADPRINLSAARLFLLVWTSTSRTSPPRRRRRAYR